MWPWGRLARVCGGADEARVAHRGIGADRGICTWGEGDFGDDANVASRRVGDEVCAESMKTLRQEHAGRIVGSWGTDKAAIAVKSPNVRLVKV